MLLQEIFSNRMMKFDTSGIEALGKLKESSIDLTNNTKLFPNIPKNRGLFITFEGGEGTGKTTQAQLLTNWMYAHNYPVMSTFEPGGTVLGNKIKRIVLDADKEINPLTEVLLFMADRAEHITQQIKPNLVLGRTVICDRFIDSTHVYQGYINGSSAKLIHFLNEEICGDLKPDLTFLLDIDPVIGLERVGIRDKPKTYFDNKELDFHKRVRQGYASFALLEPERFCWLDAEHSVHALHEQIITVIKGVLDAKSSV